MSSKSLNISITYNQANQKVSDKFIDDICLNIIKQCLVHRYGNDFRNIPQKEYNTKFKDIINNLNLDLAIEFTGQEEMWHMFGSTAPIYKIFNKFKNDFPEINWQVKQQHYRTLTKIRKKEFGQVSIGFLHTAPMTRYSYFKKQYNAVNFPHPFYKNKGGIGHRFTVKKGKGEIKCVSIGMHLDSNKRFLRTSQTSQLFDRVFGKDILSYEQIKKSACDKVLFFGDANQRLYYRDENNQNHLQSKGDPYELLGTVNPCFYISGLKLAAPNKDANTYICSEKSASNQLSHKKKREKQFETETGALDVIFEACSLKQKTISSECNQEGYNSDHRYVMSMQEITSREINENTDIARTKDFIKFLLPQGLHGFELSKEEQVYLYNQFNVIRKILFAADFLYNIDKIEDAEAFLSLALYLTDNLVNLYVPDYKSTENAKFINFKKYFSGLTTKEKFNTFERKIKKLNYSRRQELRKIISSDDLALVLSPKPRIKKTDVASGMLSFGGVAVGTLVLTSAAFGFSIGFAVPTFGASLLIGVGALILGGVAIYRSWKNRKIAKAYQAPKIIASNVPANETHAQSSQLTSDLIEHDSSEPSSPDLSCSEASSSNRGSITSDDSFGVSKHPSSSPNTPVLHAFREGAVSQAEDTEQRLFHEKYRYKR